MDPNQVDSLSTLIVGSNETMNLLLPFIIGGLIMPLVGALKKYVAFVGNVIPPEFVQGILIMITVYFLSAYFSPDMAIADVVAYSFQVTGGVTIAYGGVKIAKKLNT